MWMMNGGQIQLLQAKPAEWASGKWTGQQITAAVCVADSFSTMLCMTQHGLHNLNLLPMLMQQHTTNVHKVQPIQIHASLTTLLPMVPTDSLGSLPFISSTLSLIASMPSLGRGRGRSKVKGQFNEHKNSSVDSNTGLIVQISIV